jgi:hypothetical protein
VPTQANGLVVELLAIGVAKDQVARPALDHQPHALGAARRTGTLPVPLPGAEELDELGAVELVLNEVDHERLAVLKPTGQVEQPPDCVVQRPPRELISKRRRCCRSHHLQTPN